jgi:hypothetical protein
MKQLKHVAATILFSWILQSPSLGQASKSELSLNLGYFNKNEKLQYLQATAKSKVDGKFKPVAGLSMKFYITAEQDSNLLGKSVTNDKGIATAYIPAAAKEEWMKSETTEFLAVPDPTPAYEATKATASVTKAKIKLDTGADKKILATLLELKQGQWVVVSGVDLVLAVKRMGSDLQVAEHPTYTTDSLGEVTVDYALSGLPGDSAGNITLIAKLEDNDLFGNLTSEKIVPWGTPTRYISSTFDRRSLFARQGRSPVWLIFMAYSICTSVWLVIFYLVFQIRKLKKLGDQIA